MIDNEFELYPLVTNLVAWKCTMEVDGLPIGNGDIQLPGWLTREQLVSNSLLETDARNHGIG